MKVPAYLLAVSLLVAGKCAASLLVYDGFSSDTYNGQIADGSDGFGWTTPWSLGSPQGAAFIAEPGGLTGAQLDTTPGGVTVSDTFGPYDPQSGMVKNATLSRSFSTVGFGNTIYAGFLIRLEPLAGNPLDGDLFAGFDSQGGAIRFGAYGGNEAWWAAFWKAPASYPASPPAQGLSPSQTVHLVLKIQFNQFGANDQIALFVNPSADSEPAIVQERSDVDIGDSLTGSFYFQSYRDPPGYVDELRIGTSYADMFGAVPEPGSGALLAGGVSMFVFHGKRSQRARGTHPSDTGMT